MGRFTFNENTNLLALSSTYIGTELKASSKKECSETIEDCRMFRCCEWQESVNNEFENMPESNDPFQTPREIH
jgi:hypothetical protein